MPKVQEREPSPVPLRQTRQNTAPNELWGFERRIPTADDATEFEDLDIPYKQLHVDPTTNLHVVQVTTNFAPDDTTKERVKRSNEKFWGVTYQKTQPLWCSSIGPGESRGRSEVEAAAAVEAVTSAGFATLPNAVPDSEAYARPNAYVRTLEPPPSDLDLTIEYDMDDDDNAWLAAFNAERAHHVLPELTKEKFEEIMDRFEKEMWYKVQSKSFSELDAASKQLESMTCDVCMDGECEDVNEIVMCDGCNVAVHQACYGILNIPEGRYLCKTCTQGVTDVKCELCPLSGGAFKQTIDGKWVHVSCAMWIPETSFLDATLMEPIAGLDKIPEKRWNLRCSICKERGVGPGIQCSIVTCGKSFHVTCAQRDGIHMKVETDRWGNIRNNVYCHKHIPAGVLKKPKQVFVRPAKKFRMSKTEEDSVTVTSVAKNVKAPSQILQEVLQYWRSKRDGRHGLPLLRRFQTSVWHPSELKPGELDYILSVRHDLERVRQLCELVKKRERLKRELLKVSLEVIEVQTVPFINVGREVLQRLAKWDTSNVFTQPVPVELVTDYLTVVKTPMDFQTIGAKLESFQYRNINAFKADLKLIGTNAMKYNNPETRFYKLAEKFTTTWPTILDEELAANEREREPPQSAVKTAAEAEAEYLAMMARMAETPTVVTSTADDPVAPEPTLETKSSRARKIKFSETPARSADVSAVESEDERIEVVTRGQKGNAGRAAARRNLMVTPPKTPTPTADEVRTTRTTTGKKERAEKRVEEPEPRRKISDYFTAILPADAKRRKPTATPPQPPPAPPQHSSAKKRPTIKSPSPPVDSEFTVKGRKSGGLGFTLVRADQPAPTPRDRRKRARTPDSDEESKPREPPAKRGKPSTSRKVVQESSSTSSFAPSDDSEDDSDEESSSSDAKSSEDDDRTVAPPAKRARRASTTIARSNGTSRPGVTPRVARNRTPQGRSSAKVRATPRSSAVVTRTPVARASPATPRRASPVSVRTPRPTPNDQRVTRAAASAQKSPARRRI